MYNSYNEIEIEGLKAYHNDPLSSSSESESEEAHAPGSSIEMKELNTSLETQYEGGSRKSTKKNQ